MKNPFKVGDRVRVYGDFDGIISSVTGNDGWVKEIHPSGRMSVQIHPNGWLTEGPHNIVLCYPQQCRRLVPKKRREWKLLFMPCRHEHGIISSHVCKEWFVEGPPTDEQAIAVREVLPKKGGGK